MPLQGDKGGLSYPEQGSQHSSLWGVAISAVDAPLV